MPRCRRLAGCRRAGLLTRGGVDRTVRGRRAARDGRSAGMAVRRLSRPGRLRPPAGCRTGDVADLRYQRGRALTGPVTLTGSAFRRLPCRLDARCAPTLGGPGRYGRRLARHRVRRTVPGGPVLAGLPGMWRLRCRPVLTWLAGTRRLDRAVGARRSDERRPAVPAWPAPGRGACSPWGAPNCGFGVAGDGCGDGPVGGVAGRMVAGFVAPPGCLGGSRSGTAGWRRCGPGPARTGRLGAGPGRWGAGDARMTGSGVTAVRGCWAAAARWLLLGVARAPGGLEGAVPRRGPYRNVRLTRRQGHAMPLVVVSRALRRTGCATNRTGHGVPLVGRAVGIRWTLRAGCRIPLVGATTGGRGGVPLVRRRCRVPSAGAGGRGGLGGPVETAGVGRPLAVRQPTPGGTGSGQAPAVRASADSARSTLGRKAVGSSVWSRCRPSDCGLTGGSLRHRRHRRRTQGGGVLEGGHRDGARGL